MAFLKINGVTIPIKDGSVRRKIVRKGSTSRSVLGVMRDSGRNGRLAFVGETSTLDNAESVAIMNLIMGFGHVGNFDGEINLSTSANADLGAGCHLAMGAGWSGDALVVRSGSSASWSLQLGDEWTIFVRRRDPVSLIWKRLILRSDGQQFLDEVNSIAGVGNCIAVASGVLTLSGRSLANVAEESFYDELLAVPWFCPNSIAVQISANDQTHSAMPFVKVSGDILEHPVGMVARGYVDNASYVQRGYANRSARAKPADGGTFPQDLNWINNGVDLSFGLDEDRTLTSAANATTAPAVYLPLNTQTRAANLSTARDVVSATANASRIGSGAVTAAGPALEIDGAITLSGGTHYNLADSAAFTAAAGASGAFTACIWVKPAALTGQFLGKDDGTLREWSMTLAAGAVSFRAYGNAAGTIFKNYVWSAPAVAVGAWVFLAVSFANNSGTPTLTTMVNGEPCGQTLSTTGVYAAIQDTAAALGIGDVAVPAASSAPLAGTYAHACFFGSALTAAQIRNVYLTTKGMMNVRRS